MLIGITFLYERKDTGSIPVPITMEFTAHNIRLDDGTYTNPQLCPMDEDGWCGSFKSTLKELFPDNREQIKIADLGCLEGGFSVEIARLGFQVLGLEIRQKNHNACKYVKSKVNLPNLSFVKDDAWNLPNYGKFDCVLCCGLLYHLDAPKKFLEMIASVTDKLILNTHFATEVTAYFNLSEFTQNEGLNGRWFREFDENASLADREDFAWAAWENHKSFWIRKDELLELLYSLGFKTVIEKDVQAMRSTFVATK